MAFGLEGVGEHNPRWLQIQSAAADIFFMWTSASEWSEEMASHSLAASSHATSSRKVGAYTWAVYKSHALSSQRLGLPEVAVAPFPGCHPQFAGLERGEELHSSYRWLAERTNVSHLRCQGTQGRHKTPLTSRLFPESPVKLPRFLFSEIYK